MTKPEPVMPPLLQVPDPFPTFFLRLVPVFTRFCALTPRLILEKSSDGVTVTAKKIPYLLIAVSLIILTIRLPIELTRPGKVLKCITDTTHVHFSSV
jgi:hypothetical protein